MNLATDMARHSGRATPSLHDTPHRQFEETIGRQSTYLLPITVQTNRATSVCTHHPGRECRDPHKWRTTTRLYRTGHARARPNRNSQFRRKLATQIGQSLHTNLLACAALRGRGSSCLITLSARRKFARDRRGAPSHFYRNRLPP
jgi:hypothetical protein